MRRRSIINLLIKSAILIGIGWFIAARVVSSENLEVLWPAFISTLESGRTGLLILVLGLMPLNWFLEVLKWRLLMRQSVHLSWRNAIGGVLSGIAFSMFTPNRIGEYGGRILYVDPKHNWQAVMASLTGSFAQNLVHLTFGLLAVLLLVGSAIELPQMTGTGVWVLAGICIVVTWTLYFNLPLCARILEKWTPPRFLTKPWRALVHVSNTTRVQLIIALCFALARYAVFSLQYVLVLRFFGVEISWIYLFGGVAVIYLMHTAIPFPPFVDLIARNELGILVWSGFGANVVGITAAGLAIWVINLALPALFGLLAIATVNVMRSLGYEIKEIPTASPQPADRGMDRA